MGKPFIDKRPPVKLPHKPAPLDPRHSLLDRVIVDIGQGIEPSLEMQELVAPELQARADAIRKRNLEDLSKQQYCRDMVGRGTHRTKKVGA